jgi:hypothetical protein
MTKRRGLYVTKSERVSRVAMVVEILIPEVGKIGHDPGEDVWQPIYLCPPSRTRKRQTLRCVCGGKTPYPAAAFWKGACAHIVALLEGRLTSAPPSLRDFWFVGRLTPIGEKLFAWKIAERALAESRP